MNDGTIRTIFKVIYRLFFASVYHVISNVFKKQRTAVAQWAQGIKKYS